MLKFAVAETLVSFFTVALKEIPFDSTNTDNNYVSIARAGNLLFGVTGVIDHADLKINGLTSNISLADEEIAVLGTVNLGVM